MARLIVKSSYIKCGGGQGAGGYMKYIATRPRAERLGYDNAQAWRALLRANRNEIAAAMKIPPQDFRWYAAFHDEGKHPHVHIMAWSVKPGRVGAGDTEHDAGVVPADE